MMSGPSGLTADGCGSVFADRVAGKDKAAAAPSEPEKKVRRLTFFIAIDGFSKY